MLRAQRADRGPAATGGGAATPPLSPRAPAPDASSPAVAVPAAAVEHPVEVMVEQVDLQGLIDAAEEQVGLLPSPPSKRARTAPHDDEVVPRGPEGWRHEACMIGGW